jgi:GT2 family glycosyltransferase
MKVCAITNSYNRSKSLVERSLKASLGQEYFDYIVFIDQNTPPISLDHSIATHPKLIKKNLAVKCVSDARNSAPIPEDTDWLVFCDDDGYVDEKYSGNLLGEIKQNPTTCIFAGSIINDDKQNYYSSRHKIGGDLNKFRNSKLLMGSNFCVKLDTFRRLNGFDSRFGAGSVWGSGEETDFAWKAYFNNIQMKYTKNLIVYHERPYKGPFSQMLRKAFKYGVGKGALTSKWLFKEKKLTVALEILEMFIVPLIRVIIDIFKGKPQNTILHLSSLVGRAYGFIKFSTSLT